MTVAQFDRGYWYADELKEFAAAIGIPLAKRLRKDELEDALKVFLKTGVIKSPKNRSLPSHGIKDVERGLSLDLPVTVYTNNKETKAFLEREAQKLVPGLKRKSGARYRLNRWRDAQLAKGAKLTYGDVVKEYVRLSQAKESFKRIPHGRYINFMSDFLANERGATRKQALLAWHKLKKLDLPKHYRAWARFQQSTKKSRSRFA